MKEIGDYFGLYYDSRMGYIVKQQRLARNKTRWSLDMASSYGIVYPPALDSRHAQRAAIDMTITGIIGKTMLDEQRKNVKIETLHDLNSVGASCGVHKLLSDPPH